jgi:tryptophan synthase alpha chain
MNRINKLFEEKKGNILSVYFTAGFPSLDDTREIIIQLQKAGVDMIEIGIPFSDPLADGPVIQKSSQRAIQNGMNVSLLFSQLKNIRDQVQIPLLLMGYLNPVYQYGIDNFMKNCQETGIDGLILPDLPLKEYEEAYKTKMEAHGLKNVFLISPNTTGDRIRKIDALSGGFIYMVSTSSTTGARSGISDRQEKYFERVKAMNLKNPRLIGFGISNYSTFSVACQHAHGAIIGSAFIQAIEKGSNNLDKTIPEFIQNIIEKK